MANTGLSGPYRLVDYEINQNIDRCPGTYVLGYINQENLFAIKYVGRSDIDLNKRLHDWIGENYSSFKASCFNTAKEAFNRECQIYHDFGGSERLDNKEHPDRPDNANWECPICDIFD